MIKNFPKDGTIIAYNQSFEKRCVQSLAEYCPDLSDELLALNERFIDLIEPFRGGGFYHSKFKGSFSIKNVLPVICPSNSVLDYKALDINNGGMAMSAYKELRNSSKNVDIETTRKNLFKYCRLDTYAMYAIYIKLLQNKPKMQLAIQTRRFLSLLLLLPLLLLFPVLKQAGDHM